MLGGEKVGKSSLVSQFMTSEYLHAYDTSIGEFNQLFLDLQTLSSSDGHLNYHSTVESFFRAIYFAVNFKLFSWIDKSPRRALVSAHVNSISRTKPRMGFHRWISKHITA